MGKLYVIGNMAMDVIADPATIREDDTFYMDPETGTHYKPGGGGPYSFFAALASGARAELITSGTQDHPFIQKMRNGSNGLTRPIHTLNDEELRELQYSQRMLLPYPDFKPEFNGLHRTLYSHSQGLAITPERIVNAGIAIEDGSTFLVAPVMGEANLELIQYLKKQGRVIGTIQGWMRETDEEKRVIGKHISPEFEEALQLHDVVVFSDEDEERLSDEDKLKLRMLPGMAIRTEGEKGCKIFKKELVEGQLRIIETHLPAFALDPEISMRFYDDTAEAKAQKERALTGCGDATGATLAHNLSLGNPPEIAYRDTALTISLKIAAALKGGRGGIEGTPPVDDIIRYIYTPEGESAYNDYATQIEAATLNSKAFSPERS